MILRTVSAAAAVLLVAGLGPVAARAQAPPVIIGPGAPGSTPLGSGPYKALMEPAPGLPTHTLYRPVDLGAAEASPLPIIVWGNGACANAGNRFRWFLTEIASYGYLVVATGPIGPASQEAGPAPSATPTVHGPPASKSSQLIDGLNWAIAENERSGSPLRHRLDVKKIAVMGQSCGGVQAIEESADPRVTTSVIWNSGLFPHPTDMAGGKIMTKADLKAFHAPTAYISGDAQDVAFVNANDDFDRLTGVPAVRAWERGVPHTGTYRQPNGGEFAGVAVAWLNWRLKGDATAAKMFVGPDCGLCVNPRWVVKTKNIN